MRIYLINLEHRTDRLSRMEAEFSRAGIGFERMVAVDGANQAVRAAAELSTPGIFGRKMEAGEFAIFQSHRNCWKALLESTDDHAMVFEDDVVIKGRLADFSGSCWIPSDADIIRLETFLTRVHLQRMEHRVGLTTRSLHKMCSEQLGAACYAINRRAARRLIALSETIQGPVDNFLFSDYMPGFQTSTIYQMVPAPVAQGKRLMMSDESLPEWAVSSLKESRDAKYLSTLKKETTVARAKRRLREELSALFRGTKYVVVPHG